MPMTPEQRAAAIALLGGGAAGNAATTLGSNAMRLSADEPVTAAMPQPPTMSQADFLYGPQAAPPQAAPPPADPGMIARLLQMLRR